MPTPPSLILIPIQQDISTTLLLVQIFPDGAPHEPMLSFNAMEPILLTNLNSCRGECWGVVRPWLAALYRHWRGDTASSVPGFISVSREIFPIPIRILHWNTALQPPLLYLACSWGTVPPLKLNMLSYNSCIMKQNIVAMAMWTHLSCCQQGSSEEAVKTETKFVLLLSPNRLCELSFKIKWREV